jgi:multicomponent Na+:H+ antiporter subunit E
MGRRRLGPARLARHTAVFAVAWAIIAGGRGWAAGLPVALLAATASCWLLPPARVSLRGLLRFLPFFAWNSLRGGVDVALRALHPRLPIEPRLVRYELRLEDAVARVFMANSVTLLPGTLSADLQGDVLLVHVLNASGPFAGALAKLEGHVADLFGRHDLAPGS